MEDNKAVIYRKDIRIISNLLTVIGNSGEGGKLKTLVISYANLKTEDGWLH
jgi:hypothetical protein